MVLARGCPGFNGLIAFLSYKPMIRAHIVPLPNPFPGLRIFSSVDEIIELDYPSEPR
ncbi:MAG: hypothetical protein QXW50_05430 [Nitrososphaerota archaeon]